MKSKPQKRSISNDKNKAKAKKHTKVIPAPKSPKKRIIG